MKKLVFCLMFLYGAAYAGTSAGGVGSNNSVVNITVSGISGGDVTASSVTTTYLGVDGTDVSKIATSSVSWSTNINTNNTKIANLETSSATMNVDLNACLTDIVDLEASSVTQNVALSSLQSTKANLSGATFTGQIVIYNRTEDQLKALTPTAVGALVFDTDNVQLLIATGTAQGAWGKVADGSQGTGW